MDSLNLRIAMSKLGLRRVDLSRMFKVTDRAVDLWLGRYRRVPDRVEAVLDELVAAKPRERLEFYRKVFRLGDDEPVGWSPEVVNDFGVMKPTMITGGWIGG